MDARALSASLALLVAACSVREAPMRESAPPAPRAEAPVAQVPMPAPKVETPPPAPKVEAPSPPPKVETPPPAPKVETPPPAPKVETPPPKVEMPPPKVAKAAPKAPSVPAAPAAAPRPAPRLDLQELEKRLRATSAIGVLTKLTLKNQVDDLVAEFRAWHEGRGRKPPSELRRSFDLLVMKVLSLLQDSDPPLAQAIVESREALWGVLNDPAKLAGM